MPSDKPRFTLILEEEDLQAIEDYQFENRIKSRNAAALQIVRLGLEALERQKSESRKREELCV